MRERDIEAYLVAQVKAHGGLALKFTSPSRRSAPDRIVIMPGGYLAFVELKAPGQHPTEAQAREHERLRALGQKVYVIDTKGSVDIFVSGVPL